MAFRPSMNYGLVLPLPSHGLDNTAKQGHVFSQSLYAINRGQGNTQFTIVCSDENKCVNFFLRQAPICDPYLDTQVELTFCAGDRLKVKRFKDS